MKRGYSSQDYIDLFDKDCTEQLTFEQIRNKNVFRYRVSTIDSGPYREIEIYPLWNTHNEVRAARGATRPAQKNLNDLNARKRLGRLINANFTGADIVVAKTYDSKIMPMPTEEEALKNVRFYMRKAREYRKAHGLSDLKYIYITEHAEEGTKRTRLHHHCIMSGMDRDDAELLWDYVMLSGRFKPQAKALWKYLLTPHEQRPNDEYGQPIVPKHPFTGYVNCRRLQPDEYGFKKLANYLSKDPKGNKRWGASRNVKHPQPRTADHKLSKHRVEQLAMDMDCAGQEILEKLYPGFQFNDCDIRRSNIVSGVYIYISMKAKQAGTWRKRKARGRPKTALSLNPSPEIGRGKEMK